MSSANPADVTNSRDCGPRNLHTAELAKFNISINYSKCLRDFVKFVIKTVLAIKKYRGNGGMVNCVQILQYYKLHWITPRSFRTNSARNLCRSTSYLCIFM